jgi:stage V sporulation protein B
MISSTDSTPVKVVKGAALVLAGLAVARLLNYAYRIALARAGGMDEFGLLFLAISTIALAGGVATFGLDSGVSRFVPLYLGGDDRASLRRMLRWSILFALFSGAAAGAVLHLLARPIAESILHNPPLTPVLDLCALCLPFYVTGRVLVKAVVGFQKLGYRVAVYQVLNPTVKLLLTLVLLSFGMGVSGAIWAYLAAEALSSLALWGLLERRVFGVFRRAARETGRSAFRPGPLLVYSLPLFLAGIVDLVMNSTDVFMAGYFLDNTRVGIYGAAVTLASLVSLGTELLNPLFLSIITQEYAVGNTPAIVSAFNDNNRWFLFVTLPIAALLAALPTAAMVLFWDSSSAVGASALVILVLGRLIFYLGNTSTLVLSMHGATGFILAANLGAAVLNAGLNYWLIPVLGIDGAAVGTSVSLALQGLAIMAGARLYHRGQGLRIVHPGIVAAAVLPAAACWLAQTRLPVSWPVSIGLGLAYLGAYPILLKMFRVFSEEDRRIWGLIVARLKAGKVWAG